MLLGVLYLCIGGGFTTLALQHGGLAFLILWPAAAFVGVGIAYLVRYHGVLGKRRDGTLSPLPFLLFLPYFLLAWGIWHGLRLFGREPAFHEVAPGVWVGRRPYARELPENVRVVVDMTAEFPVHGPAIASRRYLALPTLDASVPSVVAFRELLAQLAGEEAIYIHCAAGHGRSATLAAALLVERRLAETWEHAERSMRERRPGIRINRTQRRFLRVVYRG
jgi:protein-tyrosine phosphatase